MTTINIMSYQMPKIKDDILYINGIRQKKSMTNQIKYQMPNIYKQTDNYKKWLKECEEVKKKNELLIELYNF
jgi:hypothetical protein